MRIVFWILVSRTVIVLSLAAPSVCEVVPTPGTQLVGPLFREADIVCSGVVVSTDINSSGISESGQTRLAHIRPEVLFKPDKTDNETLVVEYEGDLLWKGENALLFLKQNGEANHRYRLVDHSIGATSFEGVVGTGSGRGIVRLQASLASILRTSDATDQFSALRILQGMENLAPETMSTLILLSRSSDADVALSAIAAMLSDERPEEVERLRTYLEGYSEKAEPVALLSIGTKLGQITDQRFIVTLEALADSRFLSIRYGALDALRKMRKRESAPALIKRLDDSDVNVRYVALITLVEIFEKTGDYAPNMAIFEENPHYYTDLWKSWWLDQPR
jgi:hypothetical protein